MPVGVLAGDAIAEASNGLCAGRFSKVGRKMVNCVKERNCDGNGFEFPHVPITACAFSAEVEEEIAIARAFLSGIEDEGHKTLLNLACISVLEDVSYTRKDGQYLRWDIRSGRPLKSGIYKGYVPHSVTHWRSGSLKLLETQVCSRLNTGTDVPI